MPWLASQSLGQSFGSSSKPDVPLYTPSIKPTPVGGGDWLPGSTCSPPAAGVLPVGVLAVGVLAAGVLAAGLLPAVVVAPAVVAGAPVVAAPLAVVAVAAAVVLVDLSSLPHAARTNVVVTPTAKAAFHRARRTDPPLVCSARG